MKWWFYILLIAFPLAGGLTGYFTKINKKNNLKLVLAFAGAYLLSIVFFHLIPDLYSEIKVWSGVLLLAGFFFQVFIERFSQGVEHGHIHQHHGNRKMIPYEILISLSLHSFMEGLPLGSNLISNESIKLSFLFGIVLHELPAAFAMVGILRASHISDKKILMFILIYASMSSIGAAGSSILQTVFDPKWFSYMMAFVVGTFLHIATTILFENSENHGFSTNKIIAILLGIGMAALIR